MRSVAKRLSAISLLAAASVALGCQLPFQTSPEPTITVMDGEMRLVPGADLGLVINFKNLMGPGYQVKAAVPSPSPMPTVAKFKTSVSGGGLAAPLVKTFNASDYPNCIATLSYTNLPPGSYTVTVNALDEAGNPLYYATQENVIVNHGQPNVVTLKCKRADDSLTIIFDCQDQCGASASPSPTPTPAVDLSSKASYVTGLLVDSNQNVYLMGIDPGVTFAAPNPGDNSGRLLKVGPDHTVYGDPFNDELRFSINGEIQGNTIYLGDVAANREINLNTGASVRKGGGYYAAIDISPDRNSALWLATDFYNQLYIVNYNSPSSSILMPGIKNQSFTDYYSKYYPNYRFVTLQFDKTNSPIWTCAAGIASLGSASNNYIPNLLSSKPAGSPGAGGIALVALDGNSSKYLVTFMNDPKVYLWDRENPNAGYTVAYDFQTEYPHQIERGPDGSFYVLVSKTIKTGAYQFALDKYKVVKLVNTSNGYQLTDTIVNTP